MSCGTFICSPSSKWEHIMKRVIRSLVLINQSFCHVLTSEPVQLLVRRLLLINSWHQSASLKSTNNPYLSCWIALTQFECIGEMCPPRVHITVDSVAFAKYTDLCSSFSAWEFTLLTQSSPAFVVCSIYSVGMPPPFFLLACLMVCKHKPIPLRCFSRLHFQVPAWATRLWWWAMCKAAFSNLIKGPRYSPLKQRALEAWRNDSGKSTALICKNLHLLAGRGDARRRGRGNGRRLPLESSL